MEQLQIMSQMHNCMKITGEDNTPPTVGISLFFSKKTLPIMSLLEAPVEMHTYIELESYVTGSCNREFRTHTSIDMA